MYRKFLFVFAFISSIFPTITAAHPGNTDSSGGHTCRTNCENWELYYGEYHYHEGDYSEPLYDPQIDYDSGYQEGYHIANGYTSECKKDYEWNWEGTQNYGDGFEDGIHAGHQDGLEICYENSYAAGKEQGVSDSFEGIDYSEDIYIDDGYAEASFIEGYSDGYDQDAYEEAKATADNVETVASVNNESSLEELSDQDEDNEEKFPLSGYIIASSIAFIVGLSILHDHYRFRK